MAPALIAMDFGLMGPNYSISTACATSNYCIDAAYQHLVAGRADMIVCGGTEAAVNRVGLAGFIANRALSERNDALKKPLVLGTEIGMVLSLVREPEF